ncbi:putative transcriptional regulatory protein [Bradyrhizobium oligotrophicum S58]|uniref:Putative transcriptional regulatory protein n=1 Tax=Bradyrhizobium oligotrophicum S58 TaxID=1245469 RepID=M4ZB56_9BRAD|nr:Crp/Fnr family transcriptional regulator [Bradyrhizobium oligotrophicum]BAM90666.1 putative transcriptional regulatory protein [Bradyrhizobium oligotrophicum S58]
MPRLNQQFMTVKAGHQIKCQSEARDDVLVLCSGWAFRYIQLSDGGRQILRFLLPGDIFSPAAIFSKGMSFSAKALTEVEVSRLDGEEVRTQCRADELVMMEVFRSLGDNGRASYELITVLGQRPAERRIAHLLLSLIRRIAAHGEIPDQRYPFPLKQQHIADAVGLTSVHVSRVLALFRERNILTLADRTLQVTDPAALERLAALN